MKRSIAYCLVFFSQQPVGRSHCFPCKVLCICIRCATGREIHHSCDYTCFCSHLIDGSMFAHTLCRELIRGGSFTLFCTTEINLVQAFSLIRFCHSQQQQSRCWFVHGVELNASAHLLFTPRANLTLVSAAELSLFTGSHFHLKCH